MDLINDIGSIEIKDGVFEVQTLLGHLKQKNRFLSKDQFMELVLSKKLRMGNPADFGINSEHICGRTARWYKESEGYVLETRKDYWDYVKKCLFGDFENNTRGLMNINDLTEQDIKEIVELICSDLTSDNSTESFFLCVRGVGVVDKEDIFCPQNKNVLIDDLLEYKNLFISAENNIEEQEVETGIVIESNVGKQKAKTKLETENNIGKQEVETKISTFQPTENDLGKQKAKTDLGTENNIGKQEVETKISTFRPTENDIEKQKVGAEFMPSQNVTSSTSKEQNFGIILWLIGIIGCGICSIFLGLGLTSKLVVVLLFLFASMAITGVLFLLYEKISCWLAPCCPKISTSTPQKDLMNIKKNIEQYQDLNLPNTKKDTKYKIK